MTDPNRRRNIADSLARAEQALQIADAAMRMGSCADALSRAYYGMYHFLRALLFARGLESRTHGGAHHLFNREFVVPGTMPARYNQLLAGLQRQRELADYDPSMLFDAAESQRLIAEARAFGADVLHWLRREGLAP